MTPPATGVWRRACLRGAQELAWALTGRWARPWWPGAVLAAVLPVIAALSHAPAAALGPRLPTDAPRFLTVGATEIPRAVVNALAQDSTGFLWVATGDGLVRFDAYRFSPQTLHDLSAAEGNLGWVYALLTGRDGRVWIGTESHGLVRYDPGKDRIEPLRPAREGSGYTLITALAQTADGTVWAGLAGAGLEERPADGRPARRHRAGTDPGQLPDDRVLAVLADRDGGLWVGTWQGLVHRAPGSTRFEPVTAGDGRGLHALSVQRLYQARDGHLWAGTRQGDLLRIDPASGRVQWLSAPRGASGGGAVTAFVEPVSSEPARVWVARTTGIDLHRASDGQPLQALRHDPRDPGGLGANHVTSMLLDRSGWVWVGSLGGGLQRHNPRPTALAVRGGDADPRSPLHNPSAHSVLVLPPVTATGEEEIWVGTHDAGVVVLDSRLRLRATLRPSLLPATRPNTAPSDEPSEGRLADDVLPVAGDPDAPAPAPDQPLPRVEALALAPDGSIWLSAGGWLQQFDRHRRPLRRLWHGAGHTHQLRVGRDGTVWAGTQAGLLRGRPGESVMQLLRAQAPASGSRPLVGEVNAVAEAADLSLWVGSFHGLWRLPPGADELQPVVGAPEAGLSPLPVTGLLLDRQQRLWVDTAVTGLHRMTHWDGQSARFDAISRRLGVVGRPFGVNLLEDDRGRIWTQLHVHDPARDRIDVLTVTDGQTLGTGWFGAYAQRADGRMLFGGSRGLLQVQPAAFEPAVDVPPLVVAELRINGQHHRAADLDATLLKARPKTAPPAGAVTGDTTTPAPKGLVLHPGQRSFSVELAALEYGEPARVRYAWTLEGFDNDWTETGADQRLATYANLVPGQYLLRARASNRSGVWSDEELAIPVQVLPTWWQHDATRALFGLALAGLLLAGLQWRTQALRQRERQLARTVAERTRQLQDLTQALQRESTALKEASLTDPLTGLRNRRFLADHIEADVAASVRRWQDHQALTGRPEDRQPGQGDLPAECTDAQRQDGPAPATADLLFFLVDIDHFKRVNDLHGHAAGDAVVRQMRGRLQRVFRDSDYLVRWGGEEFLIVARGSARVHAADLAERARLAVAAEPFVLPEGEPLVCTCSLGFACFPLSVRHPHAVGWSAVVGLADAALYRAKDQGRNAWVGVLDAAELDEAALSRPRSGQQWLAEGSLNQRCSWEPLPGA